ncbi:hypothetical protein ACUA1R_004229 [Enterobacter hormaechei]|uniref:tail fiber/spike domain-containing protein n=1 Tax=Enterobacter cloacae complex TaxID=354276 RepID=UPI001BD62FEB|nr:hypothetical protein [Enterobacter hormaechei]EHN8852331.1 hypothetical protein [Enterobacter hormaechei]EHN8879830.1 hypothetical protein [Enterobacter hormaechei]MDV5436590.1 hypothetical protein [Enterobacter hormaechei]QXZ31527.1 hypothetical protein KY275_16820 [Enterobacter hormaechei]HBL5393025.1 hypothetical protein [Enterobacter hormaechei]
MATQPTNFPVPSESPRDLKFNAGKIDQFVTSDEKTYLDRFGGAHYTISGLTKLVQDAIAAYGWIPVESFQDGATLTQSNQILKDNDSGEYYRWDGAYPKVVPAGSTPETTGGFGINAWLSVGDSVLRSQLASANGYTLVPSVNVINSVVPVESFRASGLTDQQIVQQANDYAASLGRALLFQSGVTYEVVTLNCTCEWRGPGIIKRKAGASSTLINMASGARITGKMTIDGNSANCTGSASNVVMNGVSDCLLNDFSSINACGHNIEINNSVYSDNRLPNKVKNGVVNGAETGHAISLYNAANEVLEELELINCGDGINASGSTRSIRPLEISKVNSRKNRGNGFALNFISTADTPVYDMAKLDHCFARENGLNGFAIQSHYTSLTNCHAYKNGTTKDHQGFLFNADCITFASIIAFQNKGVGADFGDCRKCTGSGILSESNEWHGLEINSCEDMAFAGVILNDNFKGQVDGALQAALIIHKGNGGYPFPGDSKNISLSAVTIGSGEGQRYAVYVDADSYNVTIDGAVCKTAALLEDIFTASSDVRVRGQVTRWDPMGAARATISSGVVGIPSVADTVQVNGTGSVITINIQNGGAYIKDRYVRILSVNGMTLENSGGSGGNLFLGESIVLAAGDSVRLWSDGSGGWKKA